MSQFWGPSTSRSLANGVTMTTDPVHTEGDSPGTPVRLQWFTPSEWRSLGFALLAVFLGSIGFYFSIFGFHSEHWLAIRVQWRLHHPFSLDLFERHIPHISSMIASLGLLALMSLVLPALSRRLPPRPRRVAKLSGMMTMFILIAVFVYFVGIRVIKKMWSGAAEPQSPQAPFLRQQFSSFMDRNGDWIIPMAYLIVVCLLAVIAWTLIALLRRQSPPLPPSERKQDL